MSLVLIHSMGYDALGRRVRKTTASGTEWYVYDGDHVAFDVNSNNTIKNEYGYYPGTDALYTLKNPSWTGVAITDPRIGSVIGWADTLGNLKKRYKIHAWGRTAADTGVITRYRMAGREYDQESGLYYMRARYYDPETGRFLSEDPIGIAGGLNLYAYSGNDPVNNRDPSGMAMEVPDPGYYAALSHPSGSGLFNDFDNNGLDDFAEFADYAFARLRWIALGLGTTDQWNAIQWALDRMMDQGYANQIRRHMQFGTVNVEDLQSDTTFAYEDNFRIHLNSVGRAATIQWNNTAELGFTLAHEFAHVLQEVRYLDSYRARGKCFIERGANRAAVFATGAALAHGYYPFYTRC